MKITKHEHAYLDIEIRDQHLLIDPGIYTVDFGVQKNVAAISLSHIHDDHSYLPHLEKILQQNPEAKLFGPREVVEKLSGLEVQPVYHGDSFSVGPFTLEFFGDLHQEIHRSIPIVQNVGVLVNDALYYPGDSYTQPEYQVELLAMPASGPWLRISDVIDYVSAVKAKRVFPTHNALLNNNGHALQNARIKEVTESNGGEFRYLDIGESWQL
ncbi:MBL fold metallo-hydrolase [Candidatus Aquiluna sp. UB-MaderosW2red]|uniref:MBL fold metallo-hydrolase n=1 Tax=Candidatus Aquiluna sp. UB-MaderosW2red TaxID=1855377 RepID=UPI000875B9AB|nr:MBL fold metallo-hydrolase [Candidatus Aquiluna sp. UB-MaderosW2red]SCX14258.1 L-ascorbate metabolism protein UlaG, beta-lactamase superfamily [Candidatus Aquiluna sp. UB-MaderosW2red]